MPALVTLRLKLARLNRRRTRFNILKVIGFQIQRFAPAIVVLMVIIYVLFAIGARNAKLNNNIYELMPTEIETYKQLEKVKENFDYNPDFLTCIVKSESELLRCVKEFRNVDGVLKVESILDYLPSNQAKKLSLIRQAIEVHPEFSEVSWINVTPLHWRDLPRSISQTWVSDKEEFLMKIIPAGDLYEEIYQKELISDLRKISPNVTSQAVVWTKLIGEITTDIIRVCLLATIVIFAIIYIGFKRLNPIYALLFMIPVTSGILGLLGTYRFFGADLNAFTIGMIPFDYRNRHR